MSFLDRLQPLALLVLRLALGAIMIERGQARGRPTHARHYGYAAAPLGIPASIGCLVGAAKIGGGILVVIGLLTRLAAAQILIDMLVAILKVHLKNSLHSGRAALSSRWPAPP